MELRRPALAAALLLAACANPPDDRYPHPLPLPNELPPASPSPSPRPSPSATPTPAATPSPTGRTVYGLVTLRTATLPYFQHNLAFHLASTEVGGAAVTFTTLEQALLTYNGSVIGTTTGDDGRFTVQGQLPADAAFVATAALAGGHRLSALALPGSRDLTLDEASSMIAELARWQAPTDPRPGGAGAKALHDWPRDTLTALYQHTLALLAPGDFATSGTPPVIEALQAGAGFKLRHRYVRAFGSRVTAAGSSEADQLSDAWRALLGFRPLAVTVLAGGGAGGDDTAAASALLAGPTDAVPDAAGNVWIAEHDANAIRVVPAADRGPWLERATNLTAGRLYTLLGDDAGPVTPAAFEALYQPLETQAATLPEAAPYAVDPATREPFPILGPRRLMLEPGPADTPGIYIASDLAQRVFWIPAVDMQRFGRRVRAGRLYTLAGDGQEATPDKPDVGDGGPATAAHLSHPAALARDSLGDVFILDAGVAGDTVHGSVRLVRATDGKIQSLPVTSGGQPLRLAGATDLHLVESTAGNVLYVADAPHNTVWSIPLPHDLQALQQDAVQSIAATALFGGVSPAPPADLYAANLPVPREQAAVQAPSALALDSAGDLVVAEGDAARLRLLEAGGLTGTGGVWTVGGTFVTPPGETGVADVLEGDARLAAFPYTASLALEADGNVLLADPRANVVRRLWLRRGY